MVDFLDMAVVFLNSLDIGVPLNNVQKNRNRRDCERALKFREPRYGAFPGATLYLAALKIRRTNPSRSKVTSILVNGCSYIFICEITKEMFREMEYIGFLVSKH